MAPEDRLESEVERIASEVEAELAGLRQFQKLLHSNPTMAARLRSAIVESGSREEGDSRNGKRVAKPGAKVGVLQSHFEVVRDFLRSKGNVPQGAPDIIKGTGLTRAQVSTVLYKTRKNDFEAIRNEGSKRPVWKLKNPEGSAGH